MEENKIYQFGDSYYNINEIYKIYDNTNYENKKALKDCLSHYILSEIFKKAGLDNSDILSIANIEYKLIKGKLSKVNKFINNKIYSLRL